MTAATIPRIKAADEPARIGASLDGAEVDSEDGVRVAELRVELELVLVMSLKSLVLLVVNDAVLKVEFLAIAVPVPEALAMLVMLAVELPAAEVEVALEALPPVMEKRPE